MKTKLFFLTVVLTFVINLELNAQCQCKVFGTCYEAGCGFVNKTLCLILGGQWFVGSSCGVILPIELTEFSLEKLENNDILLHWITSSERNNMKFIIEYSNDGASWFNLTEIPGAVNSLENKEYSFVDKNLKFGSVIYYSLYQEDIDGKRELITIDNIEIENSKLLLYPNPANDNLNVMFPKLYDDNFYEIYSADGKLMYSQTENKDSSKKIDLNNFSDGIYWFKFYNNNKIEMQKFVINKNK